MKSAILPTSSRHAARPWLLVAGAIAALVLMPLIAILVLAITPTDNIWPELAASVLPRYISNSLALMLVVGVGAGVIGSVTAWLVVMTQFPGRRVLEFALLMPLAVPAYIGAYALVDFLEYAGPVQSALRATFGWTSARDYWFPEIRSFSSAAFVLSFALYPYVYLLARAAFRGQSMAMIDVSRALGKSQFRTFCTVSLPLARPAVAVGVAIVMMEVLNDFGTVEYFAVQTLTTGIFSVWLERGNAGGAAQIACVMLTLVMVLAVIEKISRKSRRYEATSRSYSPIRPRILKTHHARLALMICATPVLVGFVLPVGVLLSLAFKSSKGWLEPGLLQAAWHSAALSISAAVLAVLLGLLVVFGARQSQSNWPRLLLPVTSIGYAIPGAVLAVGVLIPLAAFDNWIADRVLDLTGYEIGLTLTGTAFAILFAYIVRFFAISQGAIDAALARISPNMDMAARSLGKAPKGVLRHVHLPLIKGSLATAGLLIAVDAMKELPATLVLRPFNFETLATRVYGLASLEDLEGAAPGALVVIAVGLLPVLLLNRFR